MNGIDLSTASDIRLGGTTVSAVYLGSTLIWPATHNYANDYFTIESLEDNNSIDFTGYSPTLYYSLDNGSTWGTYNVQVSSPSAYITLNTGDTLLLKGQVNSISYHITASKTFKVYGNIHSLLFSDSFTSMNTLPSNFKNPELFKYNHKLIDATNLILPSTNLSGRQECYSNMFYNCDNLVSGPSILPATTLEQECYLSMFENCTSLVNAPALPATTLIKGCYISMFMGCTSLVNAPALPATTLTDFCYQLMFTGCTSLVNAPALPATTLTQYCYYGMFGNCKSLITAPTLPATTLTENCYYEMFGGCSLLNNITCLATDISAYYCTTGWVYGVASNGTFTKSADMTSWPTGAAGIPPGWTVQDA